MDTMKQNTNIMYCKDKREHIIIAEKIELKPLVVFLEDCLKDIPKRDKKPDKGREQDHTSSISTEELLPITLQTSMDTMKQNANIMYCKDKRGHIILAEKIELKPLVVLLEDCLKDVPKRDKKPDKSCEQDHVSSISTEELLPITLQTANVVVNPLINCHNENVSILDTISCANGEDYVLNSLSLPESLLLHLPSTSDNDQMVKCGTIEDDSALCWGKLAEPLICEVKTPLTSGNSSLVDLDLTPPSSVASGSSLFEDRSTSFDNSTTLIFDILPRETDKVNVDNPILTENSTCKELCVKIVHFEPTLKQLQFLYRQDKYSRTHSSLKQFVPFTLEQAENNRIKNQQRLKKRSQTKQSSKVFHSTPKSKDTAGVNETIKEKNNKTKTVSKLLINKRLKRKQLKKAIKQKEAFEKRQLKSALKQKESFKKKQLKLDLNEKKEALKYRNMFANSLDSINRRICNQNVFWRMPPM